MRGMAWKSDAKLCQYVKQSVRSSNFPFVRLRRSNKTLSIIPISFTRNNIYKNHKLNFHNYHYILIKKYSYTLDKENKSELCNNYIILNWQCPFSHMWRLFHDSYIFGEVTSSEFPLPQSRYFFRITNST